MLTSIVVVSSIVQLIVTAFIYKKGGTNISYRIFLLLSVVILFWAIFNYISIVAGDSPYLTYVVRAIMLLAVLQVFLFYLFAHTFPYIVTRPSMTQLGIFVGFTLLAVAVTASPFMFRTITTNDGVINADVNSGIIVFVAYMGFCVISSFWVLVAKLRLSAGLKRDQLLIILLAASLNWILVPITNFAATLTLNTLIFVKIAPLYSLVFAGLIAYALAKRRMFDDKTVLSRSTIYVDQYLKNRKRRAIEYYELQTQVYNSDSRHVTLNFSGLKSLDEEAVNIVKRLRQYMLENDINIYFTGYSQKVFDRLRPND